METGVASAPVQERARGMSTTATTATEASSQICEVWRDNLTEEMEKIAALLPRYDHVALDTEFPGVIMQHVGQLRVPDIEYQTYRSNADLLKIIQLGLTLSDSRGELPAGVCTWQFNFQFALEEDMYAADSIELLTKQGVDWPAHRANGINVLAFGELLFTSGLVLDERITWITFHGAYDFCYLLKLLTCETLPDTERLFFATLKLYLPRFYDLKLLARKSPQLHGGLNRIADSLGLTRVGKAHQAGSDALLTVSVFHRVYKDVFDGEIDSEYLCKLFGLGESTPYRLIAQSPDIANGSPVVNAVAALTAQ